MTTGEIETIDQIYRFLTAFHPDKVKKALVIWNRERLGVKKEFVENTKLILKRGRWEEFTGTQEEIPKGYEWTKLGHKLFVRTPGARNQVQIEIEELIEDRKLSQQRAQELRDEMTAAKADRDKEKKKTDLSMKMTDKICITCGGQMAYEPICPGCKLGRHGFKGRYVCTEDMDHEFYVLRDGIILPNQGD